MRIYKKSWLWTIICLISLSSSLLSPAKGRKAKLPKMKYSIKGDFRLIPGYSPTGEITSIGAPGVNQGGKYTHCPGKHKLTLKVNGSKFIFEGHSYVGINAEKRRFDYAFVAEDIEELPEEVEQLRALSLNGVQGNIFAQPHIFSSLHSPPNSRILVFGRFENKVLITLRR